MRDGIKLSLQYILQKIPTKAYPIMILRTPYNSEPGGEKCFNDYLVNYEGIFINEGYILAFQGISGRSMSEGVFEDVRPL